MPKGRNETNQRTSSLLHLPSSYGAETFWFPASGLSRKLHPKKTFVRNFSRTKNLFRVGWDEKRQQRKELSWNFYFPWKSLISRCESVWMKIFASIADKLDWEAKDMTRILFFMGNRNFCRTRTFFYPMLFRWSNFFRWNRGGWGQGKLSLLKGMGEMENNVSNRSTRQNAFIVPAVDLHAEQLPPFLIFILLLLR